MVVGPVEYTAFPSKLVTQGDAEATCNIRGGHLAAIHSAEEQAAIAKLIGQFNSVRVPAFWLGSQLVSEGSGTARSWRWSDGTYFKYNNWTPGKEDAVED